ncbi:hypothetical protein [Micromonospora sp. RTGN7]|uniref:hypothetical protein n=1 Tax=Micromonospora sp. RTGN7 TaxID=3016526 RepID=UPI0029FEEA79|nr:hypothetical protein [Micromonospora sp. RTGN7]
MKRGWGAVVGAAIAVVVVAVVVAGVVARRAGPGESPAGPSGTLGDVGATSTVLPIPDDSYWDPGRMSSAVPAPMPTG